MKRLVLAATAALCVCVTVTSAGSPPSIPATGAGAISGYLRQVVERGDVPGVVALVVGPDGVLYHEAFGKQDAGRNVPMARDTIFRIASMTKAITSMGVMMLIDEGKLTLDAEASRWIPAMKDRRVLVRVNAAAGTYETRPATRPITIRQLLTHTSGIGYSWSDPGLALVQKKENPAEDALPLVHEPGEQFTYGSSTRVLGDIIEKISGQRIDAFLQARFFDPLGMRDTFFEVPRDKYGRVATTHQKTNGRFIETANPATLPVSLRADGGLFSTAGDYALFLRMLLNGGQLNGRRYLAERTVRDLGRTHSGRVIVRQQPSANLALSRPFPLGAGADTWALGFQRSARPAAANIRGEGSLAWAGIYNTEFWLDPTREIGAVLMMQYLPFYDEAAIATLQGFERLVNEQLK